MHIKLAGYNIDCSNLTNKDVTPESISAAYARISRSSESLENLRKEAREDIIKARNSNDKIVFEMGHSSISEHCVFNFDIENVSRLAIEEIEHTRLASYTEKSQRYQEVDSYIIPEEILGTKYEDKFKQLMESNILNYKNIKLKLYEYLVNNGYDKRTSELKAREDVRYITSLAIVGKLGMTINARSLETMIRRLLSSELIEVQNIGKKLYEIGKEVTPSLLRYCEAVKTRDTEKNIINEYLDKNIEDKKDNEFSLIMVNGTDNIILSSLFYELSDGNFNSLISNFYWEDKEKKLEIFNKIFSDLKSWDKLPRAFEFASFMFEASVSASCFAQLKRHRMMSILSKKYDINLKYVIPKTILDAGLKDEYEASIKLNEDFFKEVCEFTNISKYGLTQAHRRKVVFLINAREIYHFCRLRQDKHSQWEIRKLADNVCRSVQKEMPITFLLLCGKNEFNNVKMV